MYRTLAKLLANPNSAQLVKASCHQWKPIFIGACLASSTLLNCHQSRFGDHLKQTPTGTLFYSTSAANNNNNRATNLPHHWGKFNVCSKQLANDLIEGFVLLKQSPVYNKYKRLLEKHKNVLIASLVGSGLMALVVSSFETIPYSKRTHFVLFPRRVETMFSEIGLESMLKEYKGKVLPSTHPTSERVTLIAENLIMALQKGLTQEKVWGWKQGCNMREARRYLNHVQWEVIVINDPVITACCYPNGKIFLHTGLIEHFKTDAEIANIIGHEIGHVVARTAAEGMTMKMGLAVLRHFKHTYNSRMPRVARIKTNYDVVKASLSRKLELEADYIGLLLMASAGYDPHIGAIVWHKFVDLTGDKSFETHHLCTHPSSKMRLEFVVQALEEAMVFYEETL